MTSTIKVSVIIPCYNVEQYIDKCLDSVYGQTLREMEIICVNDGSTDATFDILNKYAARDKRIRIITQKNSGLSAARNSGLNVAKGEFVAFLDSDDFVASDYYGSMYDKAVESGADMVIGNDIWYWDDCHMQIGATHYRNFADSKKYIASARDKRHILSACAVWNKLYRRKLLNDNNLLFYPEKHLEDMPFTFMAAALAKIIVFQPYSFLFYRQRPQSIMNNTKNRTRNAMDMLDNLCRAYDELEQNQTIADKDYYKTVLAEMMMREVLIHYNMLNDTPAEKQRLLNTFADFIKKRSLDESFANPFYRQIAKVLHNDFVHKICRVKYHSYKIEFKLLGFLPVMKIRWFEPARVKWLMFGVVPVRKSQDNDYLKWLDLA